jgi:hypothetical protein
MAIGAMIHAPRIIMNITMINAPYTAGRTVSDRDSTQALKRASMTFILGWKEIFVAT